MDWICFVFTKGRHTYLVPNDSEEDAWVALAKRQSCSVENCKKWYTYKGFLNGCSNILKL